MGFQLTDRDEARLKGVNPDLVRVIRRAAASSPRRFTVIEGLRSIGRQRELVRTGASKTLNSRHLTGHAVDIAPVEDDGDVSWAWPLYYPLAKTVKAAAREEGVAIEWGGDWRSFKDGPHWQLPWAKYPGGSKESAASSAAPITEKTEKRVTAETVVTQVGSVATIVSSVVAAFAGVDWKIVLAVGFVLIVGFAAYTVIERFRSEG